MSDTKQPAEGLSVSEIEHFRKTGEMPNDSTGKPAKKFRNALCDMALRSAERAAGDDVAWLHKFINCVPFGANAPQSDIDRAHRIVEALLTSPPAGWVAVSVNRQPDGGYPGCDCCECPDGVCQINLMQEDGVSLLRRFIKRHEAAMSMLGNHPYYKISDALQVELERRLAAAPGTVGGVE